MIYKSSVIECEYLCLPVIIYVARAKALKKEGGSIIQAISQYCLREKLQLCIASQVGGCDQEWVQCDRCEAWYHCICIGISPLYFEEHEFVCCRSQEEQQQLPHSL